MTELALDFVPAPSRRTIAGWTPARQAAFIAALARGHAVAVAAASVGLTARSAYHLRRTTGGEDFALAWDAALLAGADCLADTAIERAINGTRRPIVHRGTVVGERVVHHDGLLMALLKRENGNHFHERGPVKNAKLAGRLSLPGGDA